jgi:hypothetical protein
LYVYLCNFTKKSQFYRADKTDLPGGTVCYPTQPRLICQSVRPSVILSSDITFNYSAMNHHSPTDLAKYSLKIVN